MLFSNQFRTVTLSPFTSTASITGSTAFCTFPTASNYTISAGAGNTVTWSSSNTDVATVSAGTNSQVTVTTQSQGVFTLTALITNACGQTATKTLLINGGGPTFVSFTFLGKDSIRRLCISPIDNLSFSIPQLNTSDKITANFTGLSAAEALVDSNWEFLPLNDLITLNGTRDSRSICANSVGSTGVSVRARNSCGWSAWTDLLFDISELLPISQRMASVPTMFTISPNPSSDFITINVNDNKNINLKNQHITAELYDMLFVSRKRLEIQIDNPIMDVKNLEKGIYILKISNDGHTENHQVIIK